LSFTSFDFLVFFLLVFVFYWLARERHWQNALLLAASYVFYGWVHPWYALMLGASTLADYFIARGMAAQSARKRGLLWLSLALNLGVLAFFKYYNFFSPSLVGALHGLGLNADPLLVRILLPAGLSFYTLKKLGYILDVSNGTLKPTHTLLDFALYVSFFPQIVAGPFYRPRCLIPQL
jgi:alginate O-acetyltransferase complex protein AlgI